MKKLLFFLCALLIVGTARAQMVEGPVIIQNCYQFYKVPVSGGIVRVIAGESWFSGDIDGQIKGLHLYDQTNNGNVDLGFVSAGLPFTFDAGHIYKAVVVPTDEAGPSEWGDITIQSNPLDVIIPDGCITFNKWIEFGTPPFDGLCGWSYSVTNTFSGTTYTSNTQTIYNDAVIVSEDGFCTPPEGQSWVGKHCMQTQVILTINPCDPSNFNCPPLTFSKPLTICCWDCQEYNPPQAKKDDLTGINNADHKNNFSIYPNPATNSITLQSPVHALITIYTANGQVVKKLRTTETTITIDTKEWATGIYLVKVEQSGQPTITQKLSIVHP